MYAFDDAVCGLPTARLLLQPEPGKEDVYLRILGTNGTITTGVRTTYGGDIRVSDSVIQDAKSEFVYTADGINWSVSGPAPSYTSGGRYDGTQFLACSFQSNKPVLYSDDGITWNQFTMEEMDTLSPLQLERIELNGYTFQCDRDGNVWVTDALACRRGLPNLMPLPREVFSRQKSRHIRCRRVSG